MTVMAGPGSRRLGAALSLAGFVAYAACAPTAPGGTAGPGMSASGGAPGAGGAMSGGGGGPASSGGGTSSTGGAGSSGGTSGAGGRGDAGAITSTGGQSGDLVGGSGDPGPDASPADLPTPPSGTTTCAAGGRGFDTTVTGVALDRKTCLAWQRGDPDRDVSQCPLNIRDNNSKLCWDEAVKYCAALHLDGQGDWRLPTIVELQTIVVTDNYPTIDMTVFPQAVVSLYWSSEKKGEKIVAVDFSNHGLVNDHIGPDGPQAMRCVRRAGK